MELRAKLLGSWRFLSGEWLDETGPVESGLGTNPLGLLTYDDSGAVSVQLMRPNQACFASDDWRFATDEEKTAALSAYFCYFGTFVVNEAERTVTHHIAGSWFPNLVGTDQVRSFELDGNTLSLRADGSSGRITIVWERLTRTKAASPGR